MDQLPHEELDQSCRCLAGSLPEKLPQFDSFLPK